MADIFEDCQRITASLAYKHAFPNLRLEIARNYDAITTEIIKQGDKGFMSCTYTFPCTINSIGRNFIFDLFDADGYELSFDDENRLVIDWSKAGVHEQPNK